MALVRWLKWCNCRMCFACARKQPNCWTHATENARWHRPNAANPSSGSSSCNSAPCAPLCMRRCRSTIVHSLFDWRCGCSRIVGSQANASSPALLWIPFKKVLCALFESDKSNSEDNAAWTCYSRRPTCHEVLLTLKFVVRCSLKCLIHMPVLCKANRKNFFGAAAWLKGACAFVCTAIASFGGGLFRAVVGVESIVAIVNVAFGVCAVKVLSRIGSWSSEGSCWRCFNVHFVP